MHALNINEQVMVGGMEEVLDDIIMQLQRAPRLQPVKLGATTHVLQAKIDRIVGCCIYVFVLA